MDNPPAKVGDFYAALVLVVFKHTSLPVWRGQFESDMLLNLPKALLPAAQTAAV